MAESSFRFNFVPASSAEPAAPPAPSTFGDEEIDLAPADEVLTSQPSLLPSEHDVVPILPDLQLLKVG